MAVDADERFASAIDVDAALEEVERGLKGRPLSVAERAKRLAVGAAIALPATVAALAVVGVITTLQFNGVFGRDGEFARFGREPWRSMIGYGLLAVFPIIFVMPLAAAAAVAIRFLFGLLALIAPVGAAARHVRSAGIRMIRTAGLERSAPAAQALTGLAIATLAVFAWRYSE